MRALIGSTGFVGSHLVRQSDFTDRFASHNISNALGRSFDCVVCAAAPGSMFEANRFPDQDRQRVDALTESLSQISARQFILISTIAVLENFDAGDDEETASFQSALAYGRNRRLLEVFCADRFDNCLVVRLPALFGTGLRKNFLFDILNPMPSMLTEPRFDELSDQLPDRLRTALTGIYRKDPDLGLFVIDRVALDGSGLRRAYDEAVTSLDLSAVQFTNPETRFQYYDMTRLWSDIGVALQASLEVIHLAPEPLLAKDVFKELTGQDMPRTEARLHHEDMRTRHAALWGRDGFYINGAADVLAQLRGFFAAGKTGA